MVSRSNDVHSGKNRDTIINIKPHYKLFYNENSKQIEANISWQLSAGELHSYKNKYPFRARRPLDMECGAA